MSSYRYPLAIVAAAILLALGIAHLPRPAAHGFLGVEFAPLTRAAESRTPLLAGRGALIAYVYPLGPADIAGVKAGEIVTAIDGEKVDSAEHAADLVDAKRGGDRIALALLDITQDPPKRATVAIVLAPERPPSTKIYTVHPPRSLAREGKFAPPTAANASWSSGIARGAVNPFPLSLFSGGKCSALAPDGWAVTASAPDGSAFALASPGRHVKAIFLSHSLAAGEMVDAVAAQEVARIFGMKPQMGAARDAGHGYRVAEFGTLNNYAGFVLTRVDRDAKGARATIRIAGVPATEVEGLKPLAGAVLLSIRCPSAVAGLPPDESIAPSAVSARCLAGACDESDLAGAYNEELHMGYVHAENGDNFLIDPRKDIWAMGPGGPGTYRQVTGTLEKLEPGRTN